MDYLKIYELTVRMILKKLREIIFDAICEPSLQTKDCSEENVFIKIDEIFRAGKINLNFVC
jgi:hypothetical protein